jgi:hypothetical protein
MKRHSLWISCLLVLATCINVPAKDKGAVAYPDGYRHWTHVKSMVLLPDHPLAATFGGIHHVYANDRALEGYASGTFKDGSVLVFDLLEYNQADNAGTEGARKLTGVMQKDSKRFAATGGWGYEGFAGDSKTQRLVTDGGASCQACHAQQKDHDFVFSTMR